MLPYHFLNKIGSTAADLTDLDWSCDVWSFGCLMFEMMSDGYNMPWAYEKKKLENKKQLKDFLSADKPVMTMIEAEAPTNTDDRSFFYERSKLPILQRVSKTAWWKGCDHLGHE
ncbi:unnamed protein product, partial [Mesorhabditis belari]|uniref:Serine-threonine/tyrosine-protein kinase catalytic domain-containing protein n=1 Tax=Mesorhabditis belari TaxID=2138241 RepID=A0AAF3EY31_9BILA